MIFTIVYLLVLVTLLSMVIYKQVNKIESTRAFNERTMLVLWLVLGMVGLITGGL
jgi:uncharacterized membrane protein YsdA (DUF1294 family)|tara:strand:+ start:435 stop:599 length:165 start_codon:yes stop_codon:yes gene_type:complete